MTIKRNDNKKCRLSEEMTAFGRNDEKLVISPKGSFLSGQKVTVNSVPSLRCI